MSFHFGTNFEHVDFHSGVFKLRLLVWAYGLFSNLNSNMSYEVLLIQKIFGNA